ncbi:uncharacterized protein LOC107220209 [Neodiprion lecontei]|uniref:Uncharacterized protein LOC107220209 n=1 Tax=Neodiprion lecontei TaxID=441921 RepID=A0ABM3GFQ8_NEOLC|nr:uncharacterized protein LOC107220209 [Neodiprion lecontei]
MVECKYLAVHDVKNVVLIVNHLQQAGRPSFAPILWLSILGLTLARPPNQIDLTASKGLEKLQRQRTLRSIWPFTSSETTTEAPEIYPASVPENNQWFVQGETAIPEGIDLTKYPVWKIHKYNGIDLHPVNLQPQNLYPPEGDIIEVGYAPGASPSLDYASSSYSNGYEQSQPAHETYPTGYLPTYSSQSAPYPPAVANQKSDEYHSSSFTAETDDYNIQTQQKYETYVSPQSQTQAQPLTGYPQAPQINYGPPNLQNVDYQKGQMQMYGLGEGQSSLAQPQSVDGEKPDLSFLDNLGGLGAFLPEVKDDESASNKENTDTSSSGFFEGLFSRFRGTTEAPIAEIAEEEKPASSGGFLSSVFGLGSNTTPRPEDDAPTTQSSGNILSSLLYEPQTERTVVIPPTTYYLPKTRGSYIAIKLPANTAQETVTRIVEPYKGVSNIAIYQAPSVPFTQYEIPHVAGLTVDSKYPYNLAESEVRNSGSHGLATNIDSQSPVIYGRTSQSPPNEHPYYTQNRDTYKPPGYETAAFAPYQGGAQGFAQAQYLQSNKGVPPPSGQPIYYYQEEDRSQNLGNSDTRHQSQHIQEILQTEGQSFALTNSTSYDQDQNTRDQQYQDYDTVQAVQSAAVNENEPKSSPQLSDNFVPSLVYGQGTGNIGNQVTFDVGSDPRNRGNSGDISSQDLDDTEALVEELVPPKNNEPLTTVPVYQISYSTYQSPENPLGPARTYTTPPVKDATNFQDVPYFEQGDNSRFIQDLSALTSYGTPTNSYQSDPFVSASSQVIRVAVDAPNSDKVIDRSEVGVNADEDTVRLAPVDEQESGTKKGSGLMRKVTKRRNFADGIMSSNAQTRFTPEGQTPTQETDVSMVIGSEKDSIPEVRGNRQFSGTTVIDGYSRVQHEHHQVSAPDNDQTMGLPVNHAPEAV